MKYYSEEDVYELVCSDLTTINPTVEIVFCCDCWKHHTDWCPMFKTETNEMLEHIYVITDSPDNGYCHVGERKGDIEE